MTGPGRSGALRDVSLVLFLEYASTLALFDRIGILDRELALYRALRPHLREIVVATWSRGEDEAYRERLGGMSLLHNPRGLPWPAWLAWLSVAIRFRFPGARVIKTNQLSGGRAIAALAALSGTPMIARCGFPHSAFAQRDHGAGSREALRAEAVERTVFRRAAHVVGSSDEISAIARAHGVPAGRISVVPNYVDAELLRPGPRRRAAALATPARILTIGRLAAQKGQATLIEALSGLPAALTVVGSGELRPALEAQAAALQVPVTFLGNVPHGRLYELMDEADLFALTSRFEGHPKALLEAMACGLPVVGTAVPGIREVIRHEHDGLLAAPEPGSVRAAIERILSDGALRLRIGAAARDSIVATCALDHVVGRELEVIAKAIGRQPGFAAGAAA